MTSLLVNEFSNYQNLRTESFEFHKTQPILVRRYSTISKVISVATFLMALASPVILHYAPLYVPWGIGLPSYLILLFIQGRCNQKEAQLKAQSIFYKESLHMFLDQKRFFKGFDPKILAL